MDSSGTHLPCPYIMLAPWAMAVKNSPCAPGVLIQKTKPLHLGDESTWQGVSGKGAPNTTQLHSSIQKVSPLFPAWGCSRDQLLQSCANQSTHDSLRPMKPESKISPLYQICLSGPNINNKVISALGSNTPRKHQVCSHLTYTGSLGPLNPNRLNACQVRDLGSASFSPAMTFHWNQDLIPCQALCHMLCVDYLKT